jgi:hypothetical protein
MATHGLPTWPWAQDLADALPRPERLLLDGMRLWFAEARNGHAPLPALRATFVAEDAGAALAPFDALLREAAAHRPLLGFGCTLCPRVAEAEALLLLGCALAQRGARREAVAVFLRWLPLAGAGAALPQAVRLGTALRGAGLLLRPPLRGARAGGAARPWPPPPPASPPPSPG